MLTKSTREGTKTGSLEKPAVMRILEKQKSRSGPPTKTPSARRYREASSPMESSNRTVTSSEMPLWLGFALGEMPGPGRDNWERRINFRGDSSMKSAAGGKRSGFRGARTGRGLGKLPCTTPKARHA